MATLKQAIDLCKAIEEVVPQFGCHVALTGGTLYKEGDRKDIDIILYRIRQVEEINLDGLFEALRLIGVDKKSGFGWCYKAEYYGTKIDIFFPEEQGGIYVKEVSDNTDLPEPIKIIKE
ncbi:MAG: hypothetical protein V3V40_06430 [Nitrosomonadaceae bacterium]